MNQRISHMNNPIWAEVKEPLSLRKGWHLARSELNSGFFNDTFHLQSFANNLPSQIKEIRRLLDTNSYRTKPLREVLVPKSSLSTRPGSLLPLRDRIVFWSIVRNIAPIFERSLSKDVYSYRLNHYRLMPVGLSMCFSRY